MNGSNAIILTLTGRSPDYTWIDAHLLAIVLHEFVILTTKKTFNLRLNPWKKKATSLMKKGINCSSSTQSHISTRNMRRSITSTAPTTTTSRNMIQCTELPKNGPRSCHHNITTTKMCLPKRRSTNFLRSDHGTTQSNLPLGLTPPIARITPCRHKNRNLFRNLSMKIFALVAFALQNPLWPRPSFL